MTLVVPRHAAAALFLDRQHLDRPRARRLGAGSLERFAHDAGGIQIDSVNAVDRAHLLTLWQQQRFEIEGDSLVGLSFSAGAS